MEILSCGEVVGLLLNPMPDMAYLEGTYQAATTEAGARFTQRATALDARTIMLDPSRAIRVWLRDSGTKHETCFLVMELSDGQLFGRRVFESTTIHWAIAHVPE